MADSPHRKTAKPLTTLGGVEPQIYDELGGNPRWKASALRSLGDVYRDQRRWEEAIACYQECLPVFDDLGAVWWIAATHRALGNSYRAQERWEEAFENYQKSIRIFREFGDQRWQAKAIASFGVSLAQKGDRDKAILEWRKALTILDGLDDRLGAIEARTIRGWLGE
jgi:tetratricopeptide (TPR) repeat protein